jgi:YebC/PmpR family DNA-binding regulatory protein
MSGHNRWSSIKHKKGAKDAKRGKVFTKIIKELSVAARMGGGDPDGNPRLRRAVDEARAANMPHDNVQRAIKKGTGELEGVMYEELLYEGVGPNGTLVLLDVLTDNRNRTAQEVRKIFDKHDGQLSSAGAAAWAFDEKGIIRLPLEKATEEQLFELAVGAGAEDLKAEGESWVITTPRDALDAVRDAIVAGGVEVSEADLEQIAKTPKIFGGSSGKTMLALLEILEDHDDVQTVFSEFVPSDELIAELEASA